MRKSILNPETGEWAGHDVAYSDAVAVDHPDHTRVYLSGVISDADGIEAQTRDVLSQIESSIETAGGTMNDVVRVRVYIARPHMDSQTLETVHAVRQEFFEPDHYPASTLVEVEALVVDSARIEIDADAVVPGDGWEQKAASE